MPPRHSIGLNATPRHGPPSSGGSNGATPRGTPMRRAASPGSRPPPVPNVAAARVPNVTQQNVATKLRNTANPVEKAHILASFQRPIERTKATGRSSYIDADPLTRRFCTKELSDPSTSLALWEHLKRGTPSLRAADILVPFDIQRPVEGPGSYVRRIDPKTLELQRSTVALPGAFNPRSSDQEVMPTNRLRRVPPPSPGRDHPVRAVGRARSSSPDMKALLGQPWRRTVGDYEGTAPTTRRHTLPAKADHCFSAGVVAGDASPELGTRGRRGRSPTFLYDASRAGMPSRRGVRSHSAGSAPPVNDPFAVPGDAGYTEVSVPRCKRGLADIAAHFERQPENVIAKPNPQLDARRQRMNAVKPRDHDIFTAAPKPLPVNVAPSEPNTRRSSSTPSDSKALLHWSEQSAPRAAPAAGRRPSPSRNFVDDGARAGMTMPFHDDDASPSRFRRLNDPSGVAGFSQRPNANPSPARRAPPPPVSATANLFAFGRGVMTPALASSSAQAPPAPRPTTRSQSPTHRSSGVASAFSWV